MLCFSVAWLGTTAPERAVPGCSGAGSGCSGVSSGVLWGCSGLLTKAITQPLMPAESPSPKYNTLY
jgi:hypothetical protein